MVLGYTGESETSVKLPRLVSSAATHTHTHTHTQLKSLTRIMLFKSENHSIDERYTVAVFFEQQNKTRRNPVRD